jgi:Carboxymuconolactone decarboxylase family
MDFSRSAPEASLAMLGLEKYLAASPLPKAALDLVKLRVSQINGCAYCVETHSHRDRDDQRMEPDRRDPAAGARLPPTRYFWGNRVKSGGTMRSSRQRSCTDDRPRPSSASSIPLRRICRTLATPFSPFAAIPHR